MKVRLTLEVDDHQRFVIAKFFAPAAAGKTDRERTRATRAQVRRFAIAALRKVVKDQASELRSQRSRAAARRLTDGAQPVPLADAIPSPREEQGNLQW